MCEQASLEFLDEFNSYHLDADRLMELAERLSVCANYNAIRGELFWTMSPDYVRRNRLNRIDFLHDAFDNRQDIRSEVRRNISWRGYFTWHWRKLLTRM